MKYRYVLTIEDTKLGKMSSLSVPSIDRFSKPSRILKLIPIDYFLAAFKERIDELEGKK